MINRSLFLLAASASMLSASAAQPINPCSTVFMQTESGWRGEIATRLGMMKGEFYGDYKSARADLGASSFSDGSHIGFDGYKIELENTLGYKSLLDLKFRIGFGQDILDYPLLDGGTNYAAEADAIAFFRFNVNRKAKVNLLPNVGFAWRQFYVKTPQEAVSDLWAYAERFDIGIVRILSPLIGLNLELMSPLSKFYVNAGVRVFMPSVKLKNGYSYYDSSQSPKSERCTTEKEAYRGARHGIGTSLQMKYAITQRLALSAKLDHEVFGAKGSIGTGPSSEDNRKIFSSAFTSAVFGVDYFF